MMADIGYGLVMVLAAIVAMKKIKPKGSTLAFCQLLLYAGISTMVMGALTGGFFGDIPYRLVHLIDTSPFSLSICSIPQSVLECKSA